MRNLLLFILSLSLTFSLVFSQTHRPLLPGKSPSFIRLDPTQHVYEKDHYSFLTSTLRLGPNDELREIQAYVDELGISHHKYQQYHKGIKVEMGEYMVHAQNGRVTHLNGNFVEILTVDLTPSLTSEQALGSALRHISAETYMWDVPDNSHADHHHMEYEKPEGELILYTYEEVEARPAYKFDIYAQKPLYRAFVYVDAKDGSILLEDHRIHHADVAASGSSLYNGTVNFTADQTSTGFRLRQDANGNGVETYDMNGSTNYNAASDITSSTNAFNSAGHRTGVQAHWGAEQTHTYFLQKHGRNSFDGNGSTIRSYVSYSTNYVNAFWDGQRMTYGDGDGRSFGPLVALDIVGHEITHGVTTFSANLIYRNESGALNESFSDIFGEAIERFATGSNNWRMGSDIGINRDGALRSMSNPNQYGDPDTYRGDRWFTGSGDNGGVHINSGVQNKWFYILTEGESGTNDLGNAYSVAGIGMDKAAAIAYRNLTVYLGRSSTYADARQGAIQAAKDLFGDGSNEEVQTANAWYAVGVGGPYGSIEYCASGGTSVADEWIGEVQIGSFVKTSGASSYSNFTSETVPLSPGSTVNIVLTPTFSGRSYNEYWRIWIDYNADGDFSDNGELAFDAGALNNSAVSGSISVPAGLSGTTRMRVSMKYNGAPTACESFSYGEVEDYTVDFDGGNTGGDTEKPSAPQNLIATNVAATQASIDWDDATDNVGVTAYIVYVDGNNIGSIANSQANLTGLTTGVSYDVYVTAVDAAGNESDPSNTITITPQSSADTQAPSVPTNLVASNTTINSTDLSWSASSDNVSVTGYNIYVGGSLVATSASTSFELTGLSPSTSYSVAVSAYDAAGNESALSSAINVTTPGTGGGGSSVVSGNSFETGWEDWNDGGGDATRIFSNSVSYDGSYSIRLRDNSGVASSMTSDPFDLGTAISVEVEFFFFPNSMEPGEDFGLQYNDGSGWQTVARYVSGTNFNNDVFYTATVVLQAADYNLNNGARFRFICDASANTDRIYIDAVTITANYTSVAGSDLAESSSKIEELTPGTHKPELFGEIEWDFDLLIFPNPSTSLIQVQSEDPISNLRIYDVKGQLVGEYQTVPEKIDVSKLSPGQYFLEGISQEETVKGKFVKE